jgi:hypothetical protein
MINVLLGALIGFPLVFFGNASVRRATLILSRSRTHSGQGAVDQLQQPSELLTASLDEGLERRALPGAVTEQTTLDLRERGHSVEVRQNEKEST